MADSMTHKEIARALGVTSETVRQIEAVALEKVKAILQSKGIEEIDLINCSGRDVQFESRLVD